MPLSFWDDAFSTVVYFINRLPSTTLNGVCPLTKLFHIQPNYHFPKTFGCHCYPCLRPYNSHKLGFRSLPCTFLGYSNQHKGYKCLSLDGRLYVSRDVTFNELSSPFSSKPPLLSHPTSSQSSIIQTLPLLSTPITLHPSPNPSLPTLESIPIASDSSSVTIVVSSTTTDANVPFSHATTSMPTAGTDGDDTNVSHATCISYGYLL